MRQRTHLGVLDVLRGVAALAVVLYHFTLPAGELHQFYFPGLSEWTIRGAMGVHVFFVISGFVIPLSLWNAGYTVAGFGAYLRRRVVRLAPPAYASLLLVVALWAVADGLVHHRLQLLASVTLRRLVSNALFIAPFTHEGWINGVFWTLTVEFEYYLLLGLLFPLLFGPGRLGLFLLAHLAFALLGLLPGLYIQNFFHYSPLFALGSATLLYYTGRISPATYAALLALFGGVLWATLGYERAAAGLITALLIAFARVERPVFGFLGKISYSVYLTHIPVGGALSFVLARYLHPSTDWQRVAAIGAITGLCVGAAAVFYRWFEYPWLRRAQARKPT